MHTGLESAFIMLVGHCEVRRMSTPLNLGFPRLQTSDNDVASSRL